MLKTKYSAFTLFFLVNILFVVQIHGQTNISFNEFLPDTKATESYADKGVLFSSFYGTPMIKKENLITQRNMLCAFNQRRALGMSVNFCEDLQIYFVNPKRKMVKNFASNIRIYLSSTISVTAYWRDVSGDIHKTESSFDPTNGLTIFVPAETDCIFLQSTNPDSMGYFLVTGLTFTLSQSDDVICGRPVTDASFSFHRLINEDYPQEIYARLDEYRKRAKPLEIGLQYLKPDKITYIDEFAIIVKFPVNDERNIPQQIFKAMRRKLDTVGIGEAAKTFRDIGEFSFFESSRVNNRPDGIPIVGDIYHINIFGPDDGDVMITDLFERPGASYFRYSTLNNGLSEIPGSRLEGSGSHPNNGSREYGYYHSINGWIKFYVRGIDQFYVSEASSYGSMKQTQFWLSFLEGIGNLTNSYGGQVVYPATKTFEKALIELPKCHVPPRNGYGK